MGGADPSLKSDSDLRLVGDETDGGAQHLVLGALDGVSLDADHLPADLFKCQNLDETERESHLRVVCKTVNVNLTYIENKQH